MGNVADVKGGCTNRLVDGAYRAITCWMPCNTSNTAIKRAIYNGLKGTPQACSLKHISVMREPDVELTDLYPQLKLPKGTCEFGWTCQQATNQWNVFARLLLGPVENALKRLAAILE